MSTNWVCQAQGWAALSPSNHIHVGTKEEQEKYALCKTDQLIEHNTKTFNLPCSSRYCESIIEVGQRLDVSTKTINTRAIEVHKHRPVLLHINIDFEDGIVWKALVPLQYVLKGWGDANEGHQGYSHTISRNMQRVVRVDQIPSASERDKNDYYYVGITGRNWLQRLNEHFGEIRRGSGKRFHRAWRESLGIDDVLFTSSLLSVNMTKDEAMNWEEDKVETIAYGPNGLNMIPGGYKGLKYLHKLRIIKSFDISLEEREKAITEYMWQHPRKGVRNALLSELWKDDEFYKRVNKSHPKRLSEDQVLEIHRLNDMNWAASEIFKEVGAIDERQVEDVISGKYYSRYVDH